jgi:redox-sensitive bicupin YhaK (pirin superfamily)
VRPVSTFEIRRGADRVHTRTDWLDSAHSFAFGSYYDPANLGLGVLRAFNEDVLQPGPGYPVHAHRDVEILTWVLAGSLTHREENGRSTVVEAGNLHYVSAGSGIRHTECSSYPDRPVHLVQMWLQPDGYGTPPYTARLPVDERLATGRLVLLASGPASPSEPEVLEIRQRAELSVARLPAGGTVVLPAAPLGHLFVAAGSVRISGADGPIGVLAAGDALRVADGGGERLTAAEPAELLVWVLGAPSG